MASGRLTGDQGLQWYFHSWQGHVRFLFSLCSLRLFNWPMTFLCILYRLHRRQQDLSPSELIKINVCACAVCSGKENWPWGAHHWRGRVKSLNEWGERLFRGDRSINRNNEVVVGLGLFMWIRTELGPLDLCRIFCTLRLYWETLFHLPAGTHRMFCCKFFRSGGGVGWGKQTS